MYKTVFCVAVMSIDARGGRNYEQDTHTCGTTTVMIIIIIIGSAEVHKYNNYNYMHAKQLNITHNALICNNAMLYA